MKIRDWNLNLKVRLTGETFVNIAFWMFYPFLAIYFSNEFGKTAAGFLLILSQFFAVLANLMGGYFSDQFGRKRMMIISTAGQGAVYLLFAYSASPWYHSATLSFICFTIVSVFSSFYYPASQAMIADVVDVQDRSNVYAIFYTASNLAVVIGPILGSIFYHHYRFELLLLAGILNLLLSITLKIWVIETVPDLPNYKRKAESGFQFMKQQIMDYRIIFKDTTFLLFIIAGILLAMVFMQLDLLFSIYTNEVIHQQTLFHFGDWHIKMDGEEAFGLLVSENGLIVVLFSILVTKWMNKYKERNVFIASALIYGCSMLIAGNTHFIWGLIFAVAIFTFAEVMTAGIQNSFVSEIAPEHMRAKYFSAASLRFTFGKMIAPLAIPLIEWFGNRATFLILCGFAILSGLFYWLTYQRYDKEKREAISHVIH